MSKLFIISILLFLSTTFCQNNNYIFDFFNRPFVKTESESDCLCDIDNEHCNYLCCCDTKCGENVKKYWDDRSKCIDEKDSVGIFADRCIDHTLVIDFKGHKDKNYRRRGLERIKATEDISNSNETIDNYCYSIDNSNKMKKEITNMKIDTSKITDESSSQNGNGARRLEKVNNNKNNNNKKYISINENLSFSNTNNQLRAIEEKNINITYSNDNKVFEKNNMFSLYSGSACSNNINVERMVNANYSCLMDKTTNTYQNIIIALSQNSINLSDTQCTLNKIYKIENGILNFKNSPDTPITNNIVVEVEFIIQMVNYDNIINCSINAVTKSSNDDKFNFKNTVIFSNINSIPYRYSGTNGYLNGLPLKVAVDSDVYNEFYIVGRGEDGACRKGADLNSYLYFYDKPILFNQNYSYSCSLSGDIGETILYKKLDSIDKIAKYGNSNYNKLNDQSLWINVNKDKLKPDNSLRKIKMNIYLGTRKIGVHSYKYIYKVIIKSIKTKEGTLSLDINYYDLDKKQEFKEKPRIPEFIPSMPADLLDPLIYSKVDK